MEKLCKQPPTNNCNNQIADGNDINLSIIPVSSQKTPFKGWKQYQQEPAPFDQWQTHFNNDGYVGVICGSVSDNLEIIDIDVKNDPDKTIHTEYFKLIPQELMTKLIVQSTPNEGYHLIYRCHDVSIEQSQVLAKSKAGKTIIETRGEGGYFCTHQTDYIVTKGLFDLKRLLFSIPIISKNERELLLETARSLTRYFPIKESKPFSYSEPAINEFNNKYSIAEVLSKHGWKNVDEDDQKVFWLRDGSQASHSAYYFKDSKVFYCFSTSTDFKTEKPYNNFQILQLLEGKDDYNTTLRILSKLGYETSSKPSKVTTDDIAGYLNSVGLCYDSFIQDLTYKDDILNERDYNTIYLDMKKHFEKEIPKTRYDEVIKSTYVESINPLEQYIDSHKHLEPNGMFEQWFDCITLKNKDIDRNTALKYIKRWFVALIAQATDGQFPNEYFLTLISTEQGIGKTSLLRNHTLPVDLQKYVSEHSLTFDDDFKVIMGQTLLVIDDEMDGKSWNEMKTFKTVLSSKKITLRRKYDRRISNITRRCSFAGSGNHLNVIKEYQNRRIIPIEIGHIDFKRLEQIDLDALFMEAYWLYQNGFQYSYQRGDIEELQHLYKGYVQQSDLDLLLDEYFEKPENAKDVWYVTNMDIVTGLQEKYPSLARKINAVAIGKMLSERGFEVAKKGRKKLTCYAVSANSKILYLMDNDMESSEINSPKGKIEETLAMVTKKFELQIPNNSNNNLKNE